MTVSTTSNRITYNGDGTTTVFSFPYKFLATSDLQVYVDDVLQVITTDYSVGTPSDGGANVTLLSAPAAGTSNVIILRNPDLLQQSALPSNGTFPAPTVEKMVDKTVLVIQRLSELFTRSFRLADSDTSGADTTLPTPVANNVIGWNETASALQNYTPQTFATIVAFGTANSDVFDGDGVTTDFTLSDNPGALNNLDISIGGVTQTPGADYTWMTGTDLIFTTAPPVGTGNILVRYMRGLPIAEAESAAWSQGVVGAVQRTIGNKLRDVVSVKDFGAVGDGVTDDTAAIQKAIDHVASAGGGSVKIPRGVYAVSGGLTVSKTQHNVKLVGDGSSLSIIKKSTAADFIQLTVSDFNSAQVTTQSNTLVSNANSASQIVQLASGKGANFTAGAWAIIFDNSLIQGGLSKTGEFILIDSVAGDVLTLSRPLIYSYTTANSAEIRNIDFVEGFEMSGLGFDGNNGIFGGGTALQNSCIDVWWAKSPKFTDISVYDQYSKAISFTGCMGANIDNYIAKNLPSERSYPAIYGVGGATDTGRFGYAISENGINEGLIANGVYVERVRHAYTTTSSASFCGEPTGSRINGGVASAMLATGWDTHPGAGRDITFSNCITIGSLHHGFQDRAHNTSFIDCVARNCIGAALSASNTATGTRISNLKYTDTNLGTDVYLGLNWTTKPPIDIYSAAVGAYIGNSPSLAGAKGPVIFTPIISDAQTGGNLGTASPQTGRYIISGGMCHVWISLNNINTTGMTAGNALWIQGVPLSANDSYTSTGAVRTSQLNFTGTLIANISGNSNAIVFHMSSSGSSGSSLLVSGLVSGAADLLFYLAYPVKPEWNI